MTYEDRLKEVSMESSEYRQLRRDKIINKYLRSCHEEDVEWMC